MPEPLNVLLVEDNPDDADLLSRALAQQNAGIKLRWLESLGEALTALQHSASFDVMLLDLSLPDSDGLETVERAMASVPQLPIIVLTGFDDDGMGSAAVHVGAQDFLVKGHADGRTIVRCMRYAIERHRLVADLERSNAIQTYFAATMSHELRGALFAIQGFGEMLAQSMDELGLADPAHMAHVIYERSREALALIEAALELTRSEARPRDVAAELVDVKKAVDQLAAEIVLPADRTRLQVEWHVDDPLPPLPVDTLKLMMVLRNLVGNAIKFTDAGAVRIHVAVVGGTMQFVVSDTGIGINPAEVPHLFEPFRQAHGSRSRRSGGSGLGLYIVRRLVDLLGGTIAVQSEPGKGTAFTVALPLAPASAPVDIPPAGGA